MHLLALVISIIFTTTVSAKVCPRWSSSQKGSLDLKIISEASGIGASKVEAKTLFWINDSGADSEIHATNFEGKHLRTVALSGFPNTDFEAMATAPCPSAQTENCLFVADIGDNAKIRSKLKIGIFKESDFWKSSTIKPLKIVSFSYPSRKENAESIIVTADGNFMIFAKEEGTSRVYQITPEGKATLVTTIDLKGLATPAVGKGPLITDAALSPEGDKVLLLTYGEILEFNLDVLKSNRPRNTWVKGTDYNIIPGPKLTQTETIIYVEGAKDFIVSTESEDGEEANIHRYSCSNRFIK